jgi:hypothetical protein
MLELLMLVAMCYAAENARPTERRRMAAFPGVGRVESPPAILTMDGSPVLTESDGVKVLGPVSSSYVKSFIQKLKVTRAPSTMPTMVMTMASPPTHDPLTSLQKCISESGARVNNQCDTATTVCLFEAGAEGQVIEPDKLVLDVPIRRRLQDEHAWQQPDESHCSGHCGGKSSDGGCFCDTSCEAEGDCCSDYKMSCAAVREVAEEPEEDHVVALLNSEYVCICLNGFIPDPTDSHRCLSLVPTPMPTIEDTDYYYDDSGDAADAEALAAALTVVAEAGEHPGRNHTGARRNHTGGGGGEEEEEEEEEEAEGEEEGEAEEEEEEEEDATTLLPWWILVPRV